MSVIRYGTSHANLPDPSGVHLCRAIHIALTEGMTFWVEFGESEEQPGLTSEVLLSPSIPCELLRADIPEAEDRPDVVAALLELASTGPRTMPLGLAGLNEEGVRRTLNLIREANADTEADDSRPASD